LRCSLVSETFKTYASRIDLCLSNLVSGAQRCRRYSSLKIDQNSSSRILPGEQSLVTGSKECVMNIGTVKFFNSTKGFGFIALDDGGADVFVHISAVERAGLPTILEGQKLSFDVVKDNRSGRSSAENLQAA
jgi:CspA family cold shock protein